MNKRSYALDALRGSAIILMVFSGSIIFGILPGWMYHAQVPPPTHVFDPTIPGITWVDLVFPFFLFAMGAAFPFSIKKRIEKGCSKLKLIGESGMRYLQLTFFAIFIQHFYPWTLSNPEDIRAWLLSLCCFVLLFPMFMRIPLDMPSYMRRVIKFAAFGLAFILLKSVSYAGGRCFDPHFSNIIILVLANMAFFGTVIYVFTMNNRVARFCLLPFLLAIFLGSTVEGSFTKAIYDYTPVGWLYHFNYLKYLFLVLPGTLAGEYIYDMLYSSTATERVVPEKANKRLPLFILIIAVTLIVINVVFLYNRFLLLNLLFTLFFIGIGYMLLSRDKGSWGDLRLWKQLFFTGSYFLLLGLFFEPFQEGIKKDPSTYSYYFVTAGLAFMAILIYQILCDYYHYERVTRFLILSGQNPMIAYVCTGLFTIPVLSLTGIYPFFNYFNTSFCGGVARGVIITTIAVLITLFFSRIKWFWRT